MSELWSIVKSGTWSDRLKVVWLFLILTGGWAVGCALYCWFFGGR